MVLLLANSGIAALASPSDAGIGRACQRVKILACFLANNVPLFPLITVFLLSFFRISLS